MKKPAARPLLPQDKVISILRGDPAVRKAKPVNELQIMDLGTEWVVIYKGRTLVDRLPDVTYAKLAAEVQADRIEATTGKRPSIVTY